MNFFYLADGDDTTDLGDSIAEEEMPPHSAELEAQKSLLVNFDKNWTGLQGAIRSMSTIEPHLIDCNHDEDTIEADVVEYLEGRYIYAFTLPVIREVYYCNLIVIFQ